MKNFFFIITLFFVLSMILPDEIAWGQPRIDPGPILVVPTGRTFDTEEECEIAAEDIVCIDEKCQQTTAIGARCEQKEDGTFKLSWEIAFPVYPPIY